MSGYIMPRLAIIVVVPVPVPVALQRKHII